MKTLQLSSIALAFFCVLTACTKDSSVSTDNTINSNTARAAILGTSTPNNPPNTPGNEKKPVLTATQTPAPVAVGNEVTVTYTATDATTNTQVECGKITIYQWDNANSEWDEVAVANAPQASYSFTPTTADDCAYKFRAGFAPGGKESKCQGLYSGVDYKDGSEFCVDVTKPCVNVFTIEPTVEATNIGGGLYEFSITYVLTSPVDVSGIKFQGGATAGGNEGHEITDLGNTTIVNDNKNNTVVKWTGDLQACTPTTVHFRYTRKFKCPATAAEVTGNWKASVGDLTLGEIAPLTYSCN